METRSTDLPGVLELELAASSDARGRFVKTFHAADFGSLGVDGDLAEEYYTSSRRGVLRGLHFQLPPHDHLKLVHCIRGAALDAVVDLRVGSPSYGRHALFELEADRPTMILIPPGLAHGFYARTDDTILLYKVSTVYAPESDAGILWSSAGIAWPHDDPILSDRDRGFATLAAFQSPFRFEPEHVVES